MAVKATKKFCSCSTEDETGYRAVTATGCAICCKRCGTSRPAGQQEVSRVSNITNQEA